MGNGGLGFWPRAAPPPARGGPCSCSVPPAARAARPPGARPAAPPSRFGAIAPSALFGPINGAKRKRNAGGATGRRRPRRPATGPAPALVNAGRGPPAARRPGWGRSARGPLWPGPGPPLRPRSSIAPGPQGGRARRPAPLGSICGPGRGGLDSAACGRRGTAGGINAPGWWIANERHP
jgi:hypothetical protein